MARVALLLVVLLAVGALAAATPAGAQDQSMAAPGQAMAQPAGAPTGEYPNVASLQPFTQAANFMSLPGYLRWQTAREQGIWISYAEARRIVIAQGGQLYRRA